MITVTEVAIAKIKSLWESNDAMGMAIRIKVRTEGPAAFDYNVRFVPTEDKTEQDHTVEADGVAFYIDEESVPMISGATADSASRKGIKAAHLKRPFDFSQARAR